MNIKTITLTLFLILIFKFSSFEQTSAIDSLEKLLETQIQDSNRVKMLNELGLLYLYQNTTKATAIENEALALSQEIGYFDGEAVALSHLGYINSLTGNNKAALENFEKTLIIVKHLDNKKWIAKTYTNIASIYFFLSDYGKNIEYNNIAIDLAGEIGDSLIIATSYTSAANAYLKIGNYVRALEYSFASLRIYEKLKLEQRYVGCYNNIAIIYKQQNDHEKALIYYQMALDLAKKYDNIKSIGEANNNIGIIYLERKDYKTSEDYYLKALKNFEETDYRLGYLTVLGNLGELYLITGNYELAFNNFFEAAEGFKNMENLDFYSTNLGSIASVYYETGNYKDAIKSALESYNVACSIDLLSQQNLVAKLLSDIYFEMNDFYNAYNYLNIYQQTSDSLYNIEKTKEIENIKTAYEVEKQEIEILRLEEITKFLSSENRIKELELSRNRLILIFLIFAIFMIIGISVLVIGRQKLKTLKEKQIATTKQLLIKSQIDKEKLEKENLEKELHFRRKEITSLLSEVMEKSKIIEDFENSIKSVDKKDTGKLDELVSKIKINININKTKENFYVRVEELHKDFNIKISNLVPDLTPSERKLASLLRMELSSKEIAEIMNISSKSVDMARYRLRKKLNLDNDINIVEHLKSL